MAVRWTSSTTGCDNAHDQNQAVKMGIIKNRLQEWAPSKTGCENGQHQKQAARMGSIKNRLREWTSSQSADLTPASGLFPPCLEMFAQPSSLHYIVPNWVISGYKENRERRWCREGSRQRSDKYLPKSVQCYLSGGKYSPSLSLIVL
ncbi:hypothetical protein PoB_000228900 [Plakobranchus ocellatus]|uniref:Uncharacterized protein n=1 Tax=Plakobranchus ocellatus TaxID=259542 RepID=A0AAV3Y0N6_9GAST|nr:hypothetical protein PoB_000228900 [Plakobranchus ocellatus]